jgi:formylglycine-generating enzyme required for sulfatase activity
MKSVAALLTLLVLSTAFSPARSAPPAEKEQLLPDRFMPTERSTTDAYTGLPTQILDTDSGIAFVLIQPGEFDMGATGNDPWASQWEQVHRRIIREPFYLGQTEVTVRQFRRFTANSGYRTDAELGEGSSHANRGALVTTADGGREWGARAYWRDPMPLLDYYINEDHPVVQVSWNDALAFARFYEFQLPSEAQWEYALRAGTSTPFIWGREPQDGARYGNIADWSARELFPTWNQWLNVDDGSELLATAGRYRSNGWAMFDMVGNVTEWCADNFAAYPPLWNDERPVYSQHILERVLRGSSWVDGPLASRSAQRFGLGPRERRDFVGFRVVLRVQ